MNKKNIKNLCQTRNFFGYKKGFTLVEVIISLVIVAIVTAISVPALIGYIDSAQEKAAVEECRFAVQAAGSLATEHVLETGVVAYSGEAPNNVNAAITKDAILKRAELDGKGEIISFSFNPLDNDSEYKQPTYLVNEDNDVVISAAAKSLFLAKNISPLAVSVDTTEYSGAEGISLTYMEYIASNGVSVWYHNDGYGETISTYPTTHIHVMEPSAIQDELTCLSNEKVLFKCKEDGCTYNYVEVTASSHGHHFVPLDKENHRCDNVLDAHMIVDGALVSNKHDCGKEEKHSLSDKTTKTVKKDKTLEYVVLNGDYHENQTISAGKYDYQYCTGCGLEYYDKTEELTTEPTTEPTTELTTELTTESTTEPATGGDNGIGNWIDVPSSYDTEGGTTISVSSGVWGNAGQWIKETGKVELLPYAALATVANNDSRYIKSFDFTFSFEYTGVLSNGEKLEGQDVFVTSVENNHGDYYTYEVDNVNHTVRVKSTPKYTEAALDFTQRGNTIGPGQKYDFYIHFDKVMWFDTNYELKINSLEYVDSYATKIHLNYKGANISDISRVDYYSWQVSMSDSQGNPVYGQQIDTSKNPICFYVTAGNQGPDSTVEFPIYTADNPYNPAYVVSIPRKEIVANVGGTVVRDIPSFGGTPPTDPTTEPTTEPKAYNPSLQLKVVGSSDETVDIHISPADNQQATVTTLNGVRNGDTTEISGLTDGETYVIWTAKEGYTFTVEDQERFEFTYNSSAQNVLFNAKLVKDGAVEIPEPDNGKINFEITYDCGLKDLVSGVLIGYNYPWGTINKIDVPSDDIVITDTGFALVNYSPNMNDWNGITIALIDSAGNVIGESNTIDQNIWRNSLGKTLDVQVQPMAYKLKLKVDQSLVGKNLYLKNLDGTYAVDERNAHSGHDVYPINNTDMDVLVIPKSFNDYLINVTSNTWQSHDQLAASVEVTPDESWLGTVQEVTINP